MEAWIGVYVASMMLAMKYCRGEIRCYCNDASCINKGYMCKSSQDRCFSLMTPDGANSFRPFHGCAELLSGRLATACGQPEVDNVEHDATGSGGNDHFLSRVVCCPDDMCNYNADGHIFPVPVGAAKGGDGRMQAHRTSSSDRRASDGRHPSKQGPHQTVHEETALRRDVWFRAAVIAVPIAGLVILVLLVLLAVRLLRAEHVTKSATNHSSPCILKSPPTTNHTRVTVAIANDRGDVRTVLSPSGESERVNVTKSSECNRTKYWTDEEYNHMIEASRMDNFLTFSPSSDCSKSNLNCERCCLKTDVVALTKNSNDVIV